MQIARPRGGTALLFDEGRTVIGMDRATLLRRCRDAVVLFDFMGYLGRDEFADQVEQRVFVDIDPGFGQLWRELDLHDPFRDHDVVVTVGLNASANGNIVGRTGRPTVATVPPVALEHWPVAAAVSQTARITSIATWRGPFAPLDHDGVTYGLRVHEFRRFVRLPGRVPDAHLEVVLAIDPEDVADIDLLRKEGWRLVRPGCVAADLESYREYIVGSTAELMIAKGIYVRSQGGWFSDRSACYLASGRPVVAQDTGFGAHLPTGDGLLAFSDEDGAAAALEDVLARPAHHARAAGEIARSCFDARRVLHALLEQIGVV
jgi:hypothetical protein